MTVVIAHCEQCGTVSVDADRVTIQAWDHGQTYLFTCNCGRGVERTASDRIVRLLTGVGVRVTRMTRKGCHPHIIPNIR